MWRSVLALSIAVSAFTPVALGDSTCENPVEDGVESGECLLQSQLGNARQMGKYSEHFSEDGEEEAEEDPEEEPEEDPGEEEPEEDSVEGAEESDDEGPDELEASELQYNGSDTKTCGNWFGNNLDWDSVKATGKAQGNGSPYGTMISQPQCTFYLKPGQKVCTETNFCTWDNTAGLKGVVGNQHSPGPKDGKLAYSCYGYANGKKTPCRSTTDLGKNGGGVKVDCLNGMCADKTSVKGDWSQSKAGFTCDRFSSKTGHHWRVAPTYKLLSGNGKPRLSLWDPNCKVLCETIPECTGFSVKIRGAAFCALFAGVTPETTANSKCRSHPHYNTYFLKRK